MKVVAFDGGLATRKEPHLIQANQGVIYENIDNSKGALIPLKDKKATDIEVGPHHVYFDAEDRWITTDNPVDSVEFQRKLYYTDGINFPQVSYTQLGVQKDEQLGITPPSSKLDVEVVDYFDFDITYVKRVFTIDDVTRNKPVPVKYHKVLNNWYNRMLRYLDLKKPRQFIARIVKDTAHPSKVEQDDVFASSKITLEMDERNNIEGVWEDRVVTVYDWKLSLKRDIPEGYRLELWTVAGANLGSEEIDRELLSGNRTLHRYGEMVQISLMLDNNKRTDTLNILLNTYWVNYWWHETTVGVMSRTPFMPMFLNPDNDVYNARQYMVFNAGWQIYGAGEVFPPSHAVTNLTEFYNAPDMPSWTSKFKEYTGMRGTFQYVYTFYNDFNGDESGASPLTKEIVTSIGKNVITGFEVPTDSQVTHYKIYRIGGDSTTFVEIAKIPISSTMFTDSFTVDEIVDNPSYTSLAKQNAPKGIKHLIELYAILFGAKDSRVYFTEIGEATNWPATNSLQFDGDITGLASSGVGLLVFTKHKTHLVTGTGPQAFVQHMLRKDQGCISHKSVQTIGGFAVWASAQGLCVSEGASVKVVTEDNLGPIKLNPTSSAVLNEVYYCCNADGSILVWDNRYGNVFRALGLGIDSIEVAQNKLLGYKDGVLYELFADTENLKMHYKSAELAEGSLARVKTYKKVYVSSKGDIIIKIYIDKKLVAEYDLDSKHSVKQLQIPSGCQRGYRIQFEVIGTGEVEEISYEVEHGHNT